MKTKILYAEDEPFLGKIVKESLESRSFEVIMVTDGKDGLVAYGQYKPDICVLDVMLPNKDGFKLATEIRQLNPTIPIIFLTAKTKLRIWQKDFNRVEMIISESLLAWKNSLFASIICSI